MGAWRETQCRGEGCRGHCKGGAEWPQAHTGGIAKGGPHGFVPLHDGAEDLGVEVEGLDVCVGLHSAEARDLSYGLAHPHGRSTSVHLYLAAVRQLHTHGAHHWGFLIALLAYLFASGL